MSARFLIVPLQDCMEEPEARALTETASGSARKSPRLVDMIAAKTPVLGDVILLTWGLHKPLKPELYAVGYFTNTMAPFAWQQTPLRWIPLDFKKGVEAEARWLEADEISPIREWIAGATAQVASPEPYALQLQQKMTAPAQRALPLAPVSVTEQAAPVGSSSSLRKLPSTLGGLEAPRNVILHGPPGTEKTFSTTRRALELLRVEGVSKMDDAERAEHFRAFQEHGRLAFVTFHQSYGYEEFVEGLRPRLGAKGEVQYEIHEGIFKQIALRARAIYCASVSVGDEFESRWQRLLASLAPSRIVRSFEDVDFICELGDKDNVRFVSKQPTKGGAPPPPRSAPKSTLKTLWEKRGDLSATVSPTELATALSIVNNSPNPAAVWMAWREFVSLPLVPSLERLVPQFVIVIDEINRGNISKILGELITLLEPDKRLGMSHALELPLAYSPEELFGVPPNLHILGTMNTADRSIALLDVALRRRFTFEEVMPDPLVVERELTTRTSDPGFATLVRAVLTKLNERIRFLLDREHQIGHAYLLSVRSYADLRDVFVTRIIPLLQEYFHGAWERVCIVLGCPYERPEGNGAPRPARKGHPKGTNYPAAMMTAKLLGEVEAIGFDHDDLDDRVEYEIDGDFRALKDDAKLKLYFDELVAKAT